MTTYSFSLVLSGALSGEIIRIYCKLNSAELTPEPEKVIDDSCLSNRDYGERILTNHCRNGMSCTAAQHRANCKAGLHIISHK